MTSRHRKPLDDLDRQLIELLGMDPHISQRALAEQVGVSDETVAARLRRLRDADVIATTALIDWEAAGYHAGAMARLTLSGGSVKQLTREITAIEGFHFLSLATGCCDLVLAVLGADLEALRSSLLQVSAMKNVHAIDIDIVTRTLVLDLNMLTLPIRPWAPETLPDPEPPLDELDKALIRELATAGHESNRELSRRLSVSDGTVRARMRRLEDGGLMRLVAGRDPVATGELKSYAMIFITLTDLASKKSLIAHPAVHSAHEALGSADLIIQVATEREGGVAAFVRDHIRKQSGVGEVAVAHLAEVIEHRTHLVRFV